MPSISIPTAILIGGGVMAAGSIATGAMASGAAKDAARIQADAATLASQNQMKMFQENKELLAPFVGAGTESLDAARNLLGLKEGGMDSSQIQNFLEKTPGYEFTREQGLKSIQNAYAAKGLGSSGAAIRGATDYATGLANTTYEQRLQDYLGLAASGQNAASNVANLGSNAALAASNYSTSGAAASAAGIVGSTNALNTGILNATSGISSSLLLGALNSNGAFSGAGKGNPLNIGDPVANPKYGEGTALDPSGKY